MKSRKAKIIRDTSEVRIQGTINLDGTGKYSVSTGIRFLDHMLELFAKHGLFDITLRAKGDMDIDLHHTNEDVGLALGEAFKKALGDKKGIRRMGACYVPMDETLSRVRAVVDISGRPHMDFGWAAGQKEALYTHGRTKALRRVPYDLADTKHFLESFSAKSGVTLHVDVLKAGGDIHHLLESVFKAWARAMRQAVEVDSRGRGILPSTKGKL